ncbi:MAG TPA: prepilin-type N-terminal cleavage/methylation domain-containing protein, partial [bacterium]|nr:prepilin-type N-terminal cleavage/methylation domain-containing protein [bacterium]
MKTNRRANGFTVFELLITMGLGLILLAAAYTIYLSQHRGFERVEELTNVMQSSRMAADQVTRELRMAGFGVIVGETFSEAKKYSLTFKGDIDADIATVLAADAAAGAEQIGVNLNDERDHVDAGDYIFVNGGGNVEMIRVAADADAVDLSGEPDTIKLSSALVNGYTAATTLVRTVEEVRYAVTFPGGDLKRNNVEVADKLQNFEFHYYGEDDREYEPDPVNGLTQIQRAAIRKIELRLQVGTTDGRGSRTFSQMVDLRNMGNRPFKADTCKPNPPTGLQVVQSDTCERFTVRWTEPTANACDGSALTDLGGYKIYYGTSSGDYFIPPYNVSDETLNEFTVHDLRLNNNQTYYVSMLAYDSSFNESVATGETTFTLQDTTPPDPPESVNASAGVGSVTIIWSEAEAEDVKGYRLYRGTNAGFIVGEGTRIADENTLTPDQLSFTDEGLEPCTVYYYKVTAVDCANEGEASAEVFG